MSMNTNSQRSFLKSLESSKMKITKEKLKEMIQVELEHINEGMSKREGAEVIKQLGGGRFIAMTGAKDFLLNH